MSGLVVSVLAVLGGVVLGALLTRRNERQATSERLLTEALNDIVGGIADAANGIPDAQARYASAMARLALHGNAEVVRAFREWQEIANTGTGEGRDALVAAVREARRRLDQDELDDEDVFMLLFGSRQGTGSSRPRQPDSPT
jgi:hypothetical protein